jgi:hypothetical protein
VTEGRTIDVSFMKTASPLDYHDLKASLKGSKGFRTLFLKNTRQGSIRDNGVRIDLAYSDKLLSHFSGSILRGMPRGQESALHRCSTLYAGMAVISGLKGKWKKVRLFSHPVAPLSAQRREITEAYPSLLTPGKRQY